jgi:BioD-like phosphotransacetylase family protein
MDLLLLASPKPLAGKTAIAIGLAQRIKEQGRSVALLRLFGDDHAAADAACFAGLDYNAAKTAEPREAAGIDAAAKQADVAIVEAPAGDLKDAMAALGKASVTVVAAIESAAEDVAGYCRDVGETVAGVILNRVPDRRSRSIVAAVESAGLSLVAVIPEDRTLAAPTLGDAARALAAKTTFMNASASLLLDRPLIASISSDPGQGYFLGYQPSAVVVRSDKPDLQLAALNAGAPCLIVTGSLPTLSYVLDRAQEDEVPILQTDLDTVATAQRIEEMFGVVPFSGGDAKLKRLREILGEIDTTSLIATR